MILGKKLASCHRTKKIKFWVLDNMFRAVPSNFYQLLTIKDIFWVVYTIYIHLYEE